MVRLEFEIPDYMAALGSAPFGMNHLYRRMSLALANAHARAVEDEAKANAPYKSGRLKAAISAYFAGRNLGMLEATAPYAKYLHNGTGIYGPRKKPIVIEPRGKKALMWPGALHPIKITRLKGAKPRDFMRHAALMYFPVLRAFAAGLRMRVLEIFARNYMNLRKANEYYRNRNEERKSKKRETLDYGTLDKYFHCKANCEASRLGYLAESVLLSDVKEWYDLDIDNRFFGGDHTPEGSRQDRLANRYGRARVSMEPASSCGDLCANYRPYWLPEYLW